MRWDARCAKKTPGPLGRLTASAWSTRCGQRKKEKRITRIALLMIEKELTRVQQSPKQIFESLFRVGRRFDGGQ